MPRRPSREERDWTLFTDWCASLDVSPLPADEDLLARFLTDFPASIHAQGRRVKAIRLAHERADVPFEPATPSGLSAFRVGDGWATAGEVLAHVPVYQHRKNFAAAMRARRDAWLVVLLGVMNLTRSEARTVTPNEVSLFPTLTIRGVRIEKATRPDECEACAVTRWLRIVGAASHSWWTDVKEAVSPDQDLTRHDCLTGLDGIWRRSPTLLPAIDKHGFVSAEPMSTRAISASMALRQSIISQSTPDQALRTTSTGRFASATPNELADAYDDVDDQLAALLLRSSRILEESDEMLQRISSIGL